MKKKIIIFAAALLFLTTTALSQVNETSWQLPKKALSFSFSPDSQYVFLNMFKSLKATNGTIGIFDLKGGKMTFTHEFDAKQCAFSMQKNGLLLMIMDNKSELCDYKDGHIDWTFNGKYYGLSLKADCIIFGDELSLKHFSAVKLSDGSLYREDVMPTGFTQRSWEVAFGDKNRAVIAGTRLLLFDKQKGIINSFKLPMIQRGAPNDIYPDSTGYIISYKNEIYRFDSDLNLVWNKKHPSSALTEINVFGDTIWLVNKGFQYGGMLFPREKMNRPFIILYDKKSGNEIANKFISDKSDAMFNIAWNADKSGALCFFSDRIVFQPMNDKPAITKVWNEKAFGEIKSAYLGAKVYFMNHATGELTPYEINKNKFLLTVESGDCYVIDDKLNFVKTSMDKDSYYEIFSYGNTVCAGRYCPDDNDFYLVSRDGKTLRHLPKGITSIRKVGNHVIYLKDDTINRFELK